MAFKSTLIALLLIASLWRGSAQTVWVTNGNAVNLGGGCARLTTATSNNVSSAWNPAKIDLNLPVDLSFSVNFGANDFGADGIVFVFQNSAAGTSAIGAFGGWLGYTGLNFTTGISPSYAIEMDTYDNTVDGIPDMPQDHMAIVINGMSLNQIAGPVPAIPVGPNNIEDGLDHILRVTYDPATHIINAYFDCNLRLSDTTDLVSSIFGGTNLVYYGMTSGTGSATNLQKFCELNVGSVIVDAGNDTTICSGQSVILNGVGPSTSQWSPATGLSCTNCPNPTATVTSTTTYYLTGNNGCVTAVDSVTITVDTLPTLSISANQSICNGDSVQLNAVSGSSVTWSPVIGLSCTSCPDPIAFPGSTTIYTATASNGTCDTSAQVTVTVSTAAADAGNNVSICPGDSVQLNGTASGNPSWSPANFISCINCLNPIVNPPASTTYYITVTSGPCVSVDSVIVTVNALPSLILPPDSSVCSGDSLQLIAVSNSNVLWSPAIGLSCTNCLNPWADPVIATTYSVTADNGLCSVTDSVTISVTTISVSLPDDTIICSGDSVQLNAIASGNFTWVPTTGLSCANCLNPVATPSGSITYYLFSTQGLCSAYDSVTITAVPMPSLFVSTDTLICSGGTAQLLAVSDSSVTWSPAMGLDCSSCSNPEASPVTTTTYIVTAGGAMCPAKDSVTVTVESIVITAGPDTTIYRGASVQLNAAGGTFYNWSPSTALSNVTVSNPVAMPDFTIVYYVAGTSASGCTGTDSVRIIVLSPCSTIKIPNAFTPNGDGMNDQFGLMNVQYVDFRSMKIFNRWGQLIFQSLDPNSTWDGRYKGRDEETGVYIYEVQFVCEGQTYDEKGNVTLLR